MQAVSSNNSLIIFLSEQNKLSVFSIETKTTTVVNHEVKFDKIFSTTEDLLLARPENSLSLMAFPLRDFKSFKSYQHTKKIFSATNNQGTLIIGDEFGSIFMLHNFFSD